MKKFLAYLKSKKIFFFLFIVIAVLVSNFFVISPVSREISSVPSGTNVNKSYSVFDATYLFELIIIISIVGIVLCLVVFLNGVNKRVGFKKDKNDNISFDFDEVYLRSSRSFFFLRI